MTETLFIRDGRSLQQLVERLAGQPRLAVDTEFLRERTYFPKLCLVQLAAPDLLAVVDPLGIDDLAPLWDLLTGDTEIVLHAASQDLEIVYRAVDRLPERHFDTQVAAAFLGLGDSIGYSRLIERVVGATPARSEAYTDWARRPLEPGQVEYALDDVRYLLECADSMRADLEARNRMSWVQEELTEHLAKVSEMTEPDGMWRRVSGARSLRGKALAVLQGVAAWREREAMSRDIPRQRVVPDRVLVEVARKRPTRAAQLERFRGLHPNEIRRSGADLVAVVERSVQLPESEWPSWPTPPRHAADARVDVFASVLDAVVRSQAIELELSSRLLASRADMERLARRFLAGEATLGSERLLSGWRYEHIGRQLLAVLDGTTGFHLTADPEVPAGLVLDEPTDAP